MPPHINIKRLRGRLAEERVTYKEFADAARMSLYSLQQNLAESYYPSLENRIRIADEALRRGWDDVVIKERTPSPVTR